MMEYWRQCALWLINCKVLPPNHRVTWESAQVFDLAQTLRDGVLLCQLLNNLRPQSINLKEINLRPQMSQFLCLKNIRTFLSACGETFGMKKNDLFEAFDLFDVRDFGKSETLMNGRGSLISLEPIRCEPIHCEPISCDPIRCLPRMLVTRSYFGVPSPTGGPPLNIQTGDIIELLCADLHCSWWQGRILTTKEVGFFPSDAVKPCPCVPKPVDYSTQTWFAGSMERLQAEAELINRGNSTFLVRHRSREFTEYAISIKFNNDVKHIKILAKDGCFHIAENKRFRSLLELIEYYKHHSLREGFRSLDTTLQFPYRDPENTATLRTNRPGGSTPVLCGLSIVSPAGYSFVPPSSAPFWSVFTPKVMGVAIARYDFSSRDTRELSLQEGDVVKIYTRSGANGWWRGEVNGRVGWFPSTYVEEGDE
ncbi:guanine nucleotide exchange factor VAV3-like [Osmerus mordax]|uniref:guanine nucleotide exchange factor VAV3-like n=1 Tax=Osmerus mordax TaxID=8014 RepID=UPI00350EBB34